MSLLAGRVKPRRRVLIKMLPIKDDYHNPLGLKLIDQKKHWNHAFRRGVVEAIDPVIAWRIPEVTVGSVVIINGAAGFTLDGDIMDDDDKYDDPLKGESWRWCKWKEIEAIETKEEAHGVHAGN